MGKRINNSGSPSGYRKDYGNSGAGFCSNQRYNERAKEDSDLIIEENTVYEIDRECFERLKRQKKRKASDYKRI